MASIYSSTSKGWKLRLDWSITGQSISNNRSTISLDLWVYDGTGYSQNEAANEAYYIIQGEKRWNPYNYSNTGWYKLGSKSITVNHNADGTGSVTLTAEWDCGFASNYTPRHLSLSKTVTLTTIPRASSASATGNTLGEAVEITISRASSSFTHKLYYTCGSISNQLIADDVGTSYSWTPAVTLAKQAPNAATVAVTLTVKTYNGSTYIGSKNLQLSLSIPSSIIPTLSVAISDPTGANGTYGGYVQLRSKIQVKITASGAQGSTIKSYSIKVGTIYSRNASSGTTGYLPNSGTLKITCTVTDSRGRTASKTQNVTVLAYSKPTIKSISVARCNQNGTANRSGYYGKVTFSASITPLSNINTAAYAVQYREDGADSWSTAERPAAGNFAPASVSVIFPADKNKRFEARVVATDAFDSIGSSIRDIPAAYALYHLAKHLISVGIGRLCDKANAFQVGLDAYFDKNVQIDGTATIKSGAIELNPGGALLSNGGFIDFHYGGSTESYTSRIIESGNGQINLYSPNGVKINGLSLSPESVTLTVVSDRLTDLSYTARYYPAMGMCFVRIYGVINADMTAGTNYDIISVGSHATSYVTALAVKCGKDVMASATSNGVINLRPMGENIAASGGWGVYIAGFWFA